MASKDKEASQSRTDEESKSDSISSEPLNQSGIPHGPDIVLRTFQPGDLPYANHLYYTTYFNLVPEAVKRKLFSPLTWSLFVVAFAYLMSLIPILLAGMNVPPWSYPVLRIFMGLSWTLIFFAILFGYTDRKEAVNHIEDAMCNDMADIEVYYLGWNKEEREVEDGKDSEKVQTPIGEKKVTFDKSSKAATEIVKTRKPDSERTASQFWVLTINSIPSATVAIDQRLQPVYNKRSRPIPPYKTFGQFLCRRYGFAIPSFLQIDENPEPELLFAAHQPKEASLQRLAVQRDYQGFGLSTILISRAMMWANEHKLEWVNATLNEFQGKAANILKSKHGFILVSRKSTGWFGQYEVELRCNVQEWMERYADDVKEKHFNGKK